MAYRDSRGSIVAGPLANVSIAYRNKNYIADRVFPIIDGVAPEAKILKYLKGAWFADEADIRAPGTRAKRGQIVTDYASLSTKEYAFAKEVTDEDRRFAKAAGAPPLMPDQDAIEFATDKVDLKKERRVAETVKGGTWSGQAGGEDLQGAWAAGTGNSFIASVEGETEYIRSQTGLKPNTLLITPNVLTELKRETTILDRIKYTERGIVTAALLAAMLELEEVLIGDAIYSTAKETTAGTEFSAKNVWEKNAGKGSAFLFYRPQRIGLKVPTAGLQARIKYENGLPRRTEVWRENAEHQDVYEVAEETDITAICPDLGYFWYDCILT